MIDPTEQVRIHPHSRRLEHQNPRTQGHPDTRCPSFMCGVRVVDNLARGVQNAPMTDDGDIIHIESGAPEPESQAFTPWEQRLVAAIQVAQGARVGVVILRVVAALAAGFALLGVALLVFVQDDSGAIFGDGGLTGRQQWGQFLQSVAAPLAFAGIVFGLSYVVEIAAARLDVDIVMADDDERGAA